MFIGGTGIISSACSDLAVRQGINLWVLNRGTSHRALPPGVRQPTADIRDPQSVERALGDLQFDSVCNFIAFVPEHVESDIRVFRNRTRQYVFISSAVRTRNPCNSGH